MPDQSPRLALPFIQPSQAQKHVTHNEALLTLDTVVQLAVDSFDAITPPSLPLEGETHALGTGAIGSWAGYDGNIAAYHDTAWRFSPPQEGWRAWDKTGAQMRAYSGGIWTSISQDMQNIDGVGINTSSDATNRLAVAADATLLTHDGNDHQLKINKAAAADTASVLFQTGWSSRAEVGLSGDDNLHLKVSSDGSTFQEALTVNSSSGVTDVKCLHSGLITIADDSVGAITTPSAGGFVLITIVDAAYPQPTHSGILVYDTGNSLALTSMALASNMQNHGATTLTGTTGTDGFTNIGVTTGQILIENRFGVSRIYSYTFLGGL